MEFLDQNFFDTATQLVVNSNTITAEFLMNPDLRIQATSDGMNDDTLTYQVRINFDSTMTVGRLALMGTNVKGFTAFYNGVTANTFALVAGQTTVSSFTGNTQTCLYMPVTPVACTSVTFDFKTTMVANSEKAVGFLAVTQNTYSFPRIPGAGNFTPIVVIKELLHTLSDGGMRSHRVATKWNHQIKFDYISQSDRDALKTIYDLNKPQFFVPFGTVTGWDGVLYEAVWTGNFSFYKNSDDAVSAGYSGQIQLNES